MDTETQIAAKLQANIPKPEPSQAQAIPVVETGDRGFVDDLGDSTNLYKLYDYFNVEPQFRNGSAEQKLQIIYRWAADKVQSTDYLAVAGVLTSYGQGMGSGQLGQSSLDSMYQFIQLDRQIGQLKQEQERLYA